METVIICGRSIDVNPLTRGQIKELKAHGFSYFFCSPGVEKAHDAMDAAFEIVLSKDDVAFLDTLPVKESFAVWKALLAETYGGGDDEGNLSATLDGGSTSKGSNTAESAGPEKQM